MHISHPLMRLGTSLAAVALATTPAVAWTASAHASPDAGKLVRTLTHVDSPHAFWEKDTFSLRSHADPNPLTLIEDTVNWIGKGWFNNSRSTYTFTIPDDPQLSFLGKPGQTLYRAPALPDTNSYSPTWQGVGADGDIPIEKFRDGQFTLDLVHVDGPGRVEFFNYLGGNVSRILSSHDEQYRSYWMTRGTHTHNETTFTKPGRYEITYRVSARLSDGTLLQSKEQTMAYQVGGVNPTDTIKDIPQAYQSASSQPGKDPGKPTFTLKHNTNIVRDADDKLTVLDFSTGKESDQGTVVFYIDGYYLSESKVVNGHAEWPEMLGSLKSSIQAVYIPTQGDTPRWISQPLSYQEGVDNLSTSEGSDTFPTAHSDDPNPPIALQDQ